MRIRLLNPSIYSNMDISPNVKDPMHMQESYPVIVEATTADSFGHEFEGRMNVTFEELDRVFPYGFKRNKHNPGKGLGWWNNPVKRSADTPEVSWEPVTPFDYWNKLKSSRPVGDVVPAGYL